MIAFISKWFLVGSLVMLSACSGVDSPQSVSKDFWQAVQEQNMDSAKQLSTWDSVDYLKVLKSERFHPERFDLGEVMLSESHAEVETILYTTKMGKSGVKVPGTTVLVMTKNGWRVDVKKTLGSVVKHSMNNVFDQLNGLMQESIKELDKTLSKSMNELGKALEEGAEELKKELSKPLLREHQNNTPPVTKPKGQQI